MGLRWMSGLALGLMLLGAIGLGVLEYRHQAGNERAHALFRDTVTTPVQALGSTRNLRILPLLEFRSADPALLTEVGVSYLVETDTHRILYDVGQNSRGLVHSSLQRNMASLGIEL